MIFIGKSNLKHGMLVRILGTWWGMVIKGDVTDKVGIKFFYDDHLLVNHGFWETPEVMP